MNVARINQIDNFNNLIKVFKIIKIKLLIIFSWTLYNNIRDLIKIIHYLINQFLDRILLFGINQIIKDKEVLVSNNNKRLINLIKIIILIRKTKYKNKL